MADAQVVLTLQNQATPQIQQTAQATRQLAQEQKQAQAAAAQLAGAQTQAQRSAIALADSEIRAARAAGDYQRALGLVHVQLASATPDSVRYNQVLATQASVAKQAEQAGRSQVSQLLDIKGALVGVVGAFSVANVAGMAYNEVVGRTKEGFELVATLEASRKSIDLQLGSLRNTGVVYSQAAAFGDKYKLTQKEINESLVAGVPILRQSTSSTTDLLGVFGRLTVLKPEKSIDDAARAIQELQAGQINSIATQFNISRDAANKMKDEIAGGADAVQVVARYLDSAGVGMDALAAKSQGAAGAAKDLAIASEQINLALGGIAASKGGLATIETLAQAGRGLAGVLNGEMRTSLTSLGVGLKENSVLTQISTLGLSNLVGVFGPTVAAQQASAAASQQQAVAQAGANAELTKAATVTFTAGAAYEAAAKSGANLATTGGLISSSLGEQALKASKSAVESKRLADLQAELARLGPAVAAGLADSGAAALALASKYGIASNEASALLALQAQIAGAAVARQGYEDQRAGERAGGTDDTAASLAARKKTDAEVARREKERQDALKAAREEQVYSTGTTAQKLALARQEAAATQAGTAERIRAETKVMQLEQQAAREREAASKKGVKAGAADEKASLALLEPEERLLALRQKLANLNPASTEYKQTLKEIRDLEKQAADETERRASAAVDASLAVLDDRKARREEAKRVAQAQRVLASGHASADQRAAAEDVLARVPLEQQKRALEIAQKTRDAGGVAAATGPVGATPIPTGPVLPVGAPRAGSAAGGLPVGAGAGGGGAPVNVSVQVLLDGAEIANRIHVTVNGGVIGNLYNGYLRSKSSSPRSL